MTKSAPIAIIGAGIGGLTLAAALEQRGIAVQVFEKAEELGDVGAGLTITANAALALYDLGLREAFEALDPPTPDLGTLHYATGERLNYEKRDLAAHLAKFGALTRQVHRADLHSMLAGAVASETVRTGHTLTGLAEHADHVELHFANGARALCQAVIGCDGLKSAVRATHFSAAPARFTGFVAWRGLVAREALPDLDLAPHFATYPAPDKLFVRYPVRGGALINYVAIARKPDFTTESWNTRAEVSEVTDEFAGWHEDVGDIIRATPANACMRWALYTREPLDRWTSERVALLGDAAHPMTPFFGMGAAMAIEDACVLTRCLAKDEGDIAKAFKRYETARLERGNHMQRISLDRAQAYMSGNPTERNKRPGEGLAAIMAYNPVTAPI